MAIKLPILAGLHAATRLAFKMAGYKWELRRSDELELGLWRIKLGRSKKTNPKRFVLVPGFGDSSFSWLAVLAFLRPVLQSKYDEVVLVDFPGFAGFQAKKSAFPSMDLLLLALGDCLDSLQPHTIMGHSLGGWLTSSYAVSCGEGTRATTRKYSGPEMIILADPSGAFGSEEERKVLIDLFRGTGEHGFESIRGKLFTKEPMWFPLVASEAGQFLAAPEISAFLHSIREDHIVQPRLKHIRARVWLLWGEDDALVPSGWHTEWLSALKSSPSDQLLAQAVLIRGAGHSVHIEKPAVVAAAVTQMLLGKTPHDLGKRWWKVVS